MAPEQSELIERLRALLSSEPSTREVSMFGGRSFMVHDRIIVSALKDGDLLVRVPADRHDELLERPGAAQAEMGAGRTMGPGWIHLSAAFIETADALSPWLAMALEHNKSRS